MFSDIEAELTSYAQYKGHLKDSAAIFKEALEFHLGLTRKLERVYTYAHLKSDEDKSDQHYQGFHQRALNLLTRASETASFITPEIHAIADEVEASILAEFPGAEVIIHEDPASLIEPVVKLTE